MKTNKDRNFLIGEINRLLGTAKLRDIQVLYWYLIAPEQ